MKLYKAWFGKSEEVALHKLFRSENQAKTWIKQSAEFNNRRGIKELKGSECLECGRLVSVEDNFSCPICDRKKKRLE